MTNKRYDLQSPQQIAEFVASVIAEERARGNDPVVWVELHEDDLGIPAGQRLCKRVWVSDDGQVATQAEYADPQILSPGNRHDGYLGVIIYAFDPLTNKTYPHTRDVHRLVLIGFHGAPKPGQVARHIDGVRQHNTVGNLQWGTPAENTADMIRHGRSPGRRWLPMQPARKRLLLADIRNTSMTYDDIAAKYSVSNRWVRKLRQMHNLPRKPLGRPVKRSAE